MAFPYSMIWGILLVILSSCAHARRKHTYRRPSSFQWDSPCPEAEWKLSVDDWLCSGKDRYECFRNPCLGIWEGGIWEGHVEDCVRLQYCTFIQEEGPIVCGPSNEFWGVVSGQVRYPYEHLFFPIELDTDLDHLCDSNLTSFDCNFNSTFPDYDCDGMSCVCKPDHFCIRPTYNWDYWDCCQKTCDPEDVLDCEHEWVCDGKPRCKNETFLCSDNVWVGRQNEDTCDFVLCEEAMDICGSEEPRLWMCEDGTMASRSPSHQCHFVCPEGLVSFVPGSQTQSLSPSIPPSLSPTDTASETPSLSPNPTSSSIPSMKPSLIVPSSLSGDATITLDPRYRWTGGGLAENVLRGANDPAHFYTCPDTHMGYCADNPDASPYIEVDLGETKSISSVTLWHYWGDFRQYCSQSLKLSLDGQKWNEIYSTGQDYGPIEDMNGGGHVFDISAMDPFGVGLPARYIRHHCGPSTMNSHVHFLHIEVMGVDHRPCSC